MTFYSEILIDQGRAYVKDTTDLNEASRKTDEIFAQKGKIVILLFVPLAALNGFILRNRKKLNVSEHSILAGMILLGILLLSLFDSIFFYFNLRIEFSDLFANFIDILITSLTLLYMGYGYYNAFGSDYSIMGFAWRILMFFAMMFLEIW